MADFLPTIQTNAAGPKSTNIDGNSATQHSLPDQIALDKYVKAGCALKRRRLGLRYVRLRAPGCSDVNFDCR